MLEKSQKVNEKKLEKTRESAKSKERPVQSSMESENASESNAAVHPHASLETRIDLLLKVCSGARVTSFMLQSVGLRLVGSIAYSTASKKLIQLLNEASDAELEQLAASPAMRTMMKMPVRDLRRQLLDTMVTHVKDVEVLIDMIGTRFGVPIGLKRANPRHIPNWLPPNNPENDQEVEWTCNGLQHVYMTYQKLPQADLNLVKCLFTYKTNGDCGGAAWGANGIYFVNYNDNDTDAVESGQFTEERAEELYGQEDSSTGVVILDKTTAHELGHIVDASVTPNYSEMESFRKLSGWKSHPKSNPKQLVQDIYALMTDPMPKAKEGEEQKTLNSLTFAVAEQMITNAEVRNKTQINDDQIIAFFESLRESSTLHVAAEHGLVTYDEKSGEYSYSHGAQQLFYRITDSPLITHILSSFAEKSPWYYNEISPLLPKRQIHESYSWKNCWYSFDNRAWTDGKISKYQFRDPCEEFAELYGTYFLTKKHGEKVPDHLRKWFEGMGLNDVNRHRQPTTKGQKRNNLF